MKISPNGHKQSPKRASIHYKMGIKPQQKSLMTGLNPEEKGRQPLPGGNKEAQTFVPRKCHKEPETTMEDKLASDEAEWKPHPQLGMQLTDNNGRAKCDDENKMKTQAKHLWKKKTRVEVVVCVDPTRCHQ